ncbi:MULTISPECIES: tripartite tricarboxylate transporter permease [unclassified Xanthobacter]|uniref:tripartite tricarboxylate transporter permease n=1 Tax=unclassified Xanthobacter TaxID=2623496 RepID=UPI001EE15498|nr:MULTISPECIES: tripartite tricarboxylate transporter permease [unclassified Xanthobacter]
MENLPSLFANIGIGLETALSPANLWYCFVGVFLGTFIGVLPGIGPLAAMSMLFPITFYLDPTSALIMLAGIWYGTAYGSSTAAILINVPGSASSAVTSLDGYPLARQGRAGVALFLTAAASFVGGSIGIVLMMLFSPVIVAYAMKFGSAEYFALMVLGLVAASSISEGSVLKSLAMTLAGIIFGTVGMDIYTGSERFTFGMLELDEGIGLIPVAMGLFGVAEVISSVRLPPLEALREKVTLRSMMPTRDDIRRSIAPTLRGTGIGAFFGTLPGTGPTIASFLSYAVEKRVAKDPSRFGHGAIEGIVSPEAANNAADQTAFIPTMTLGIPGSATMALMIGALMIQGITPGPEMMTSHPDVFWGLVMSFWIGNVLLLVLNVPLIGIWVRLLTLPYHLLYPAILAFICVGIFGVSNTTFGVWVVIFFGAMGFLMRWARLPAASLLLGFVLGPLMEQHFRRAMAISQGDFMTFVDRPISLGIFVITGCILAYGIWLHLRRRLG